MVSTEVDVMTKAAMVAAAQGQHQQGSTSTASTCVLLGLCALVAAGAAGFAAGGRGR